MSPLGRIFLVANLLLAALFVAFAGTYLQRDDHWKSQFDKEVKARADDVARLTGKNASLTQEVNNANRVASNLETKNKQIEGQLKDKDREIVDMRGRLSTIENTLKSNTTHLGNIQSELSAARQDSKAAMAKAIAAEAAKDEAVAAQNAAEKSLADANFKIENMGEENSKLATTVALRDQSIREQNVIIELFKIRFPGALATLSPQVTGTVSQVSASGNLVTIALKNGAENLKTGARFAIFNQAEGGYKGEATVTDIDGSKQFCFARLTLKQGKTIKSGDSAATNLDRSSGN